MTLVMTGQSAIASAPIFGETDAIQITGENLNEDNRTLERNASVFNFDQETYTLQTDVLGEFQTGIVGHDLLLGVELERNISSQAEFLNRDESFPIDVFDPEYGNIPDDLEIPLLFDGTTTSNTIGVYAQDLLSIGEQVKILLGGRFDWLSQNFEVRLGEDSSETNQDTAFSPRVGIVYQPLPPVSLYAGWSRSFAPQFGVDREGNPFLPITGKQFEVGERSF